jgi:hypothetical protein
VSVSAGETVSLQGSGSDADSTNLVYLWEQLSGQTVTLNGTDNPELTFTAPTSSGTLSFRLTVTDEMGADHSDTVTVTVTVAVAAVTTTPAPVERKKGGGGAVGYLILTMLLVLLTRQKKTESPSLNRTSTKHLAIQYNFGNLCETR